MIKFTTFICLLVTVAICSSQKISVPVQYLQCNGASQPEPSDELRGIPGQRGDKGELGVPSSSSSYEEYEERSRIFNNRLEILRTRFTSTTDENFEIRSGWSRTKNEAKGTVRSVRNTMEEVLENLNKTSSELKNIKERLSEVRTTLRITMVLGKTRMILDFQKGLLHRLENATRYEASIFEGAFAKVRSCKDVPKVYGHKKDGDYAIQPNDDVLPFKVTCVFDGNMEEYEETYEDVEDVEYDDSFFGSYSPYDFNQSINKRTNKTATLVHHDTEDKTEVNGYEEPKSYKRSIKYDEASIEQIRALIEHVGNCRQYIVYECVRSSMFTRYGYTYNYTYNYNNRLPGYNAGWDNWNGTTRHYWGGADGREGYCACGITGTCWEEDPTLKCKCDINRRKRGGVKDSGYLTQQEDLPVTTLYFGDTGASSEVGFHNLGPLQCVED